MEASAAVIVVTRKYFSLPVCRQQPCDQGQQKQKEDECTQATGDVTV
jgi:hypothetical protein